MQRKTVLNQLVRRRIAVNFVDSDAVFTGRLAEYDDHTYVIDQCYTHPKHPDETAQPIAGRQYIDRIHCFLTELPAKDTPH